jgi:FixJ family two-component response regulator
MKAGAAYFLVKPFRTQALLEAARQAIDQYLEFANAATHVRNIRQRFESLSPRDREVMALVVSGRPNKQVGHRPGIAEKTIKVHRARVMQKMVADSLPALVRMAQKPVSKTQSPDQARYETRLVLDKGSFPPFATA